MDRDIPSIPRQFDETSLQMMAGCASAFATNFGPEKATKFCEAFFRLYVKCESPIETRMAVFVAWSCVMHTKRKLAAAAQVHVEGYRCDFGIYLDDVLIAAIECDGHDFHERTKEQATRDRSRDRKLSSAGLLVSRFTGQEIWRMSMDQMLDEIRAIIRRAKAVAPTLGA